MKNLKNDKNNRHYWWLWVWQVYPNKIFKEKKFTLHDSDKEVHKLYKNPNADFKKHLLSLGLITSLKTKQINKKEIAEKIFLIKT